MEAQLFNQDEGSLVEMIGNLGIEDVVMGKTKMQKIKIIRKEIDSKMDSDEKVARTCLEQLLTYMKGTVPPLEPTGESTEEAKQRAGTTGVKRENKSTEVKIKKLQVKQGAAEHILSELEKTKAVPSLLRREFKLSGHVGEPGQTEKLTFVSLMHQIDSGLKRGYKESEIVDAVIRGISWYLTSPFQNYAEFSMSTTRRKLHQRFTNNLQQYASKAVTFQERSHV